MLLKPNRRSFMTAIAGGVMAPAILRTGSAWAAEPAVVDTASGRLRGIRDNRAVSFKGVPYAAPTSGRGRFLAPGPVEKWSGIRDAADYGPRAPQGPGLPGAIEPTGRIPIFGEDCCVLNIFAPDLNHSARRPVMVWIHGGGFQLGSGEVDGANLAKFGDVVVVGVNHRLNVLGYSHLGFLDSDFADSANVGQLDLIAALEWVKTNIGQFGGDPGNVTLFGQSGGGSKITTLQVMPKAKGLYRRTINMSGSSGFSLKWPADEERVTIELLKVLGIDRGQLRQLQEVPVKQLIAASQTAIANAKGEAARPMVDGRNVLYQPLSAEGLAMYASMPTIFSTTSTEAAFILGMDKRNLTVTAEQVKARIASTYQLDEQRSREVMAGYTLDDPQRSPFDVLLAAASEAWVRAAIHRGMAAKSAVGQGPTYMLDFNFKVDPVLGAPHAADIPYAFGNQVLGDNTYGQLMPRPDKVGHVVATSEMATFVAFARHGNPNNRHIPVWQPYDLKQRATLVMEEHPRCVDDYRGNDRQTSESLPPQDPMSVSRSALFRAG